MKFSTSKMRLRLVVAVLATITAVIAQPGKSAKAEGLVIGITNTKVEPKPESGKKISVQPVFSANAKIPVKKFGDKLWYVITDECTSSLAAQEVCDFPPEPSDTESLNNVLPGLLVPAKNLVVVEEFALRECTDFYRIARRSSLLQADLANKISDCALVNRNYRDLENRAAKLFKKNRTDEYRLLFDRVAKIRSDANYTTKFKSALSRYKVQNLIVSVHEKDVGEKIAQNTQPKKKKTSPKGSAKQNINSQINKSIGQLKTEINRLATAEEKMGNRLRNIEKSGKNIKNAFKKEIFF